MEVSVKMHRMKKWVKFILFVVAACALQWSCHKATDGFAIEKISSSLSFHPEWEVSSPSEEELTELRAIFKQKFRYLAKGAQCFVFASEDGQTVIKFFRHSHMRPPLWLTLSAFPGSLENFRQEKIAKQWDKLGKDFASYKLAYQTMQERTGIRFLHLNKTKTLNCAVTIVDKIGIAHTLDLDTMEFLVQKKATLVYPTLDTLISQGNVEEAKHALTDLVSLLKWRAEKGIFDKDPDLNTNFGFVEGKAVQIDVGRFKESGCTGSREELLRITDNLQQWLQNKSPELCEHLLKEINV